MLRVVCFKHDKLGNTRLHSALTRPAKSITPVNSGVKQCDGLEAVARRHGIQVKIYCCRETINRTGKILPISVVMPAFNEESGIAEFIEELNEHLKEWNPTFFVVDDCSKDQTVKVAQSLTQLGIRIKVVSNEVNRGHGPSVVKALYLGLSIEPELIVAIDGDGQFIGPDVAKIVNEFVISDCDIAEGVRIKRGEPLYRRLVTLTTRLLVYCRCRQLPRDANTPLRVYKPSALSQILEVVGCEAMVPNLVISTNSRRRKMTIIQITVRSIPRRGLDESSVTWGNKWRQLPTRRFINFCFNAVKDFFRQY